MKTPEEIIKENWHHLLSETEKALIVKIIKTTQTEAYNQALKDAAESAETDYYDSYVDQQSILKLKK